MKRAIIALASVSIIACKTTQKVAPTANANKVEQNSTTTAAVKPIEKKVETASKMSSEVITTPSGLKYTITEKGNGRKPQAGEKVTVHYTGKLLNDSVFDSSVKRGKPFTFALGMGQVIKGWDEGIAQLNVGDKAILTIPPDLGYGSRDLGVIPPNSTLIFEVQLLDVKPKPVPQEPKAYDIAGKKVEKTASGLEYVMIEQGKGDQASAGKNVSVHYTGYLENGTIFDSSVRRGEPIDFPLGRGYVIKGWDEGIALLKVGGKARLIIPSELGYGDAGSPPVIPAKAKLIFDVELVGVE